MSTRKNFLKVGAVIIFACVLLLSNVFLFNRQNESYGETGSDVKQGFQDDTLFYYCYDEKMYLIFSEEKIVVKLNELTPVNMTGFTQSQPEIDTTKDPESVGYGFSIFYVVPGTDIEQLLADLQTNRYVEMANPVYLFRDDSRSDLIVRDKFSVKFDSSVTRSEIEALNDSHNVVIVDSIYIPELVDNIFLMKITPLSDKNILGMANFYNEDPRTIYSAPDFLTEIILYHIPSDPYFPYQYNFHNTGQTGGKEDADIDAPEAWDITIGLPSIEIAVIDDGIEPHEDLCSLRLVDGIDWAGDSVGDPNNQIPDYDPSPGDSSAHGMCCAGLAGASWGQLGVAGMAPACKIQPVKIWDNYGRTTSAYYLAEAFYSTMKKDVRNVLSCSWGWPYCWAFVFPEVADAINEVSRPSKKHPGSIVVFAAGNGSMGCIPHPANMEVVIAVGATDKFDNVWSYSNKGSQLDVVAPSGNCNFQGDIWTVDIEGDRGYNPTYTQDDCENTDYTGKFGGTSAAAPQVAGLAALIRSQHLDLFPGEDPLSYVDIKNIICKSAEDSQYYGEEDTIWRDSSIGFGRANAFRALLAISRGEVNHDYQINYADVIYLANYYFGKGPEPVPVEEMGDFNCDGLITLSDPINLAFYINGKIPKPPPCYRF